MTETTLHRLQENARQRPADPAYFVKRDGAWRPTSWAEHLAEVRRAARALVALGFQPGQAVGILGFNRPEWVVFDLAGMLAGGAAAGIYVTSSPEDVQYVLGHCEAGIVLLENEEQWEKVRQTRGALPLLRHAVLMRGCRIDDPMALDWDSFLAKGDGVPEAEVDSRLAGLQGEQLATLIYTSGTMGPPKGVMLSHGNLAWTGSTALGVGDLSAADSTLSYLPLSHVAEQVFSIHAPIWGGYPVYFAEAVTKVADNLKEIQPTIVFGVPRVWERFHEAVRAKLAAEKGLKAKILAWAQGVGRRVTALKNRGEKPSGALALQYRLASRLVFSKIKPLLGLGNARLCICGGAPVSREIPEFFSGLDVVIHEVYGQSEDAATSFNRTGATRFGTVGPPWPGIEVRIAEDGEVLVRGPNVFLGYYKDPAATAEALEGGWLHSGDLGRLDDGYLTLSGRKKEILITSGGKNVAPANIEMALKRLELVADAVVVGDRRRYIASLLTLDPAAAARFAERHGLDGQTLHDHPLVVAEIDRFIAGEVNPHLAKVEQVRRFRILPRNLSIEEGELTPTLKVKRRVVYERFAAEIEALYAEP
ncbi:MAG TPA: long-chain fatty acid--CoA ligase [Thermoanaerobaculia bacterium]|nr:long-chain fatty acid--CoA ligase [Thermoanaerobaculia bacterium]